MSIAELLKKNFVMIPVIISILVGTFTGVKYIVSLTETIDKNRDQIAIINDTHLKNQIGYIARIQENQSHLLLKLETNNGNTIVTENKLKRMEEKIKQLETDFMNLLIKRSE